MVDRHRMCCLKDCPRREEKVTLLSLNAPDEIQVIEKRELDEENREISPAHRGFKSHLPPHSKSINRK